MSRRGYDSDTHRAGWQMAMVLNGQTAPDPFEGAFLLKEIKAGSGYRAVTNAQTLLDRFVAMRDGTDPQRAAHPERDRMCVDALTERHIVPPRERAPPARADRRRHRHRPGQGSRFEL